MRAMSARLLLFLMASTAAAAVPPPTAPSPLIHMSLHQSWGGGDEELELKDAALNSSGTLWLVVGARPRGMLSGAQRLSVWHVDAAGKVLGRIPLNSLPRQTQSGPFSTGSVRIGILEDGAPVLMAPGEAAGLEFYRLDAVSGKLVTDVSVPVGRGSIAVTKLVSGSDGDPGIAVVGRKDSHGFIARLTSPLRPDPIITLPDPALAVVLDVIRGGSSSYVAIGTGAAEAGELPLTLAVLAPDGRILKRMAFKGVFARVALQQPVEAAALGYTLVQGKGTPNGTEVTVAGFTADLTPTWKTIIADNSPCVQGFVIGPLISGKGTLAVGCDAQHRLSVVAVGGDGQLLSRGGVEENSAAGVYVSDYKLLSARDRYVIPFTELVARRRSDGKFEQRQMITVVAFQQP